MVLRLPEDIETSFCVFLVFVVFAQVSDFWKVTVVSPFIACLDHVSVLLVHVFVTLNFSVYFSVRV